MILVISKAPILGFWISGLLGTLLDLCVSSLRRGHANLLCIVPTLSDDPPKGLRFHSAGLPGSRLRFRGYGAGRFMTLGLPGFGS